MVRKINHACETIFDINTVEQIMDNSVCTHKQNYTQALLEHFKYTQNNRKVLLKLFKSTDFENLSTKLKRVQDFGLSVRVLVLVIILRLSRNLCMLFRFTITHSLLKMMHIQQTVSVQRRTKNTITQRSMGRTFQNYIFMELAFQC